MLDALFFTLFIFVAQFAFGVYDYFKNKKTIQFSTVVYNQVTNVGNVVFILFGLLSAALIHKIIALL